MLGALEVQEAGNSRSVPPEDMEANPNCYSQNGGNLSRDPQDNLHHNVGTHIMTHISALAGQPSHVPSS